MRQPKVIEQNAKCFFADTSLPNVLMTIQLRSARGFRVVAVPDLNGIQSKGGIEMLQSLVNALLADNVVSGNVRVTSIDAGADRNDSAQALQHLRDLLEASAEREFRAGRVLDQNGCLLYTSRCV